MDTGINKLIIEQIEVRLIECGIHRILSCIDKLSDEQLQFRPNSNSNSINNQILHLNGNVRQWLLAALTNESDGRKREDEFDHKNRKNREQLKDLLTMLEMDVRAIMPKIDILDLSEMRQVQCYQESIISIIIHVIEHFSYHVGQITYITKMLLDIDTGYYEGLDLNKVQ